MRASTVLSSLNRHRSMAKRTFPLVILLVAALGLSTAPHGPAAAPSPVAIVYDGDVLRSGDVIVRRGRGLLSQAVLAGDSASRYSHVGLVAVGPGGAWVVHAAPGQPGVRFEPLADFLASDAAEAAAALRPTELDSARAHAAVASALAYVGRPFDHGLDETTDSEIYCTELVWRAFAEAGADLGLEPTRLSLPVGPEAAILVSQVVGSTRLNSAPGFRARRVDVPE